MRNSRKKVHKKSYLTAKLTIFDWGWADKIIYKLRGKSNEKLKGLMMIEKLKEVFGISNKEVKTHQDDSIEEEKQELRKIKWTRDEEGNIISPYKIRKLK